MRVIAISMGVPADAIFLDENARNTYENIKFSRDMMLAHNWKKAILISSPYHTLRASLVFKKMSPDMRIMYAPLRKSVFFDSDGRVRARHILAVLHEYAGIAYYMFRGYI